jgi:magnesium-transporting ATPase (P-type)
LSLSRGDQIVADGTVLTADGLALDEAKLTGESEPALRHAGDPSVGWRRSQHGHKIATRRQQRHERARAGRGSVTTHPI